MIQLRLPLRHIFVTQPFGANYMDFYRQWGLKGHNGVDFRAMDGFNCYAAHSGVVSLARTYKDSDNPNKKPMKHVEIWDKESGFKTIYLHLADYAVLEGEEVQAGQIIGHCDNTGTYTNGDHLHFGLKETDAQGNTLNKENGYNGAIDPTPYFSFAFDGTPIGNKDCYKSNAYHRYFRKRDWGAYLNEVKVLKALIIKLKRVPTTEQVNACTYGGWNWEAVANPAMYNNWAFLKRSEIEAGYKPFQTI